MPHETCFLDNRANIDVIRDPRMQFDRNKSNGNRVADRSSTFRSARFLV